VAWIGYGGKEDPVEFGAALELDKKQEQSDGERYDCPVPEYLEDKTIQKVQTWAGCSFNEAFDMLNENPVRFDRILGWANAEAEAEPHAYKRAKAEMEAEKSHNEAAAPDW